MKPPSIIIVDQDSEARDILMLAFESRGYMTWTCSGVEVAVSLFLTAQPDVVLIDLGDDEEHSLNFVQTWKKAAPRTQVIVQSRFADESRRQEALDRGAYAYLMKPVTPEVLFETLSTHAEASESPQLA